MYIYTFAFREVSFSFACVGSRDIFIFRCPNRNVPSVSVTDCVSVWTLLHGGSERNIFHIKCWEFFF